MSVSPAKDEIHPLTGIRGFAAIFVVLYHFHDSWVLLFPALQHIRPFVNHGYLGVDLFFVLSGFIISYVHPPSPSPMSLAAYGKFLWLRFARIYPNHLFTIALLFALAVIGHFTHIQLVADCQFAALPTQLTMTHAWPHVPRYLWNYPSWSISAEWFAYLCIFPASWAVLRRVQRPLFLAILAYAALAAWWALPANPAIHSYRALIRVSCEFFAGSMFFGIYQNAPKATALFQRSASLLFIALVCVFQFIPPQDESSIAVALFLIPPFLLGLTTQRSAIAKLLSTPVALWLGRASYALYMSHALTQSLLTAWLPAEKFTSTLTRPGVLLAHIALLLLFAAFLYHCVEVPSRNLLRRWGRQLPARSPLK